MLRETRIYTAFSNETRVYTLLRAEKLAYEKANKEKYKKSKCTATHKERVNEQELSALIKQNNQEYSRQDLGTQTKIANVTTKNFTNRESLCTEREIYI